MLTGLTVETLTAPIVALLPLTFLDGHAIFAWSKGVWMLVYAAAAATFALVLLPMPSTWVQVPSLFSPWAIAFAAFTALSIVIWAYFRLSNSARLRAREREEAERVGEAEAREVEARITDDTHLIDTVSE